MQPTLLFNSCLVLVVKHCTDGTVSVRRQNFGWIRARSDSKACQLAASKQKRDG